MQLKPFVQNETSENKELRQKALSFGFCTLHLGVLTEKAEEIKCKTFMFKLSGTAPKRAGDRYHIYTLGLRVINYGERFRLGFIRRKQILEKI